MNNLLRLWEHKQSFWMDFIRRSHTNSGALKKMVAEQGLRGMTSNPTIFEKAIGSGDEYDADLKRLAERGLSNEQIFEALSISDIQKAADVLSPVFKSSGGRDGFVSLEVDPNLANDTAGTIDQAKRLFKTLKRPNVMIKVPGTDAGFPAIEELTAAGLNINITLLFSVDSYKKVVEAYLKGLERRVRKGLPIKSIASVASFFVSRVDVIVDKHLDAIIAQGGPKAEKAKSLLHKAAVANAKLAYAHYKDVVASPRWAKLVAKGAQPQRLLWASTGGKDKRLPDTYYIDELIGPDTVNTMPPQTAEAFLDHGKVKDTIFDGWNQARADIAALAEVGVDFDALMRKLQEDGVRLFIQSFEQLMRGVGAKREILTGAQTKRMTLELGSYAPKLSSALERIEKEGWIKRIWEKEPGLWKNEPAHQAIIKNALGWLTVYGEVKRRIPELNAIVADVRKAKFTNVLLLGMGGSSLCPEVLRLTFGRKAGYPDFAILDSTEPASVAQRASWSKPEKTLYVVASKSGSTTEPNAFFAYFYDLVKKKRGEKAGDHFIAITDPGTSMERVAKEKKFRHIVLNPPDIGGRYSALSFFGMLPAALMGIDVAKFLASAASVADACAPIVPAAKNPGAILGAALGVLGVAGRDKITFVLSKEIASFSTWVEQLIAESTGKEGKGLLPIEAEGLEAPAAYGDDRVFVSLETKADAKATAKLAALKRAGHPIIRIRVPAKVDIAGEFFRWEFATAVAGAILGIDPFDQPNVQESKDLTKKYLDEFRSQGKLDGSAPTARENGFAVYASNRIPSAHTAADAVKALLSSVKRGDYVALLAYIERNEKNERALQSIRQEILKTKKVATTIGFGPRFLHSTGQLHKGGGDNGVFLQITADDKKDVPIPGEPYTFSTLKEAQALGDLSALANKGRRYVRVHLTHLDKGLEELRQLIADGLRS